MTPKEHTIPAVENTIALLEYLGKCEDGATHAELSSELGMSTSTCYRIIRTLLFAGWLKRLPANRYDIDSGILAAARKVADEIDRFNDTIPILEKLANQTRMEAKISIRRGDYQITLHRAESPRPVAVSGRVDAQFPIIEGSVGATLLLDSDKKEIENLVQDCIEDIEEKNQPTLLLSRIDEVRQNGYCLNRNNRWRICALSAPIYDRKANVVASLTLIGWEEDFGDNKLVKVSTLVKSAARRCSTVI